ncbi:tRNA delta(2)-isopentenylpyrophosphate transferase [Oceanicola sp. 22II-s10i]|uniref:tRNA (adenosine(37)-N6)-dimethylallyltransferase MiaA n=1 Tax=Oceanicola sp. 22II-s10i TaxID=1317116 RepID=UPI000B529296|nr:tRNA (adenosine(37)-N6)-dimethylallyltransferase MiaA [Oceanicola sp. 22II-s10i]OWU83573.1 tRNA delta(2)-isopentenylpyrophosphate transferase [Oceanicola sp. 22II-s10i]
MKAPADLDRERPVLIAGPTASGKSALAMEIAARDGGVIVNADALQVYDNWRILSARPSAADEAALPHRLFGHVGRFTPYSTGHWLRDIAPLLTGGERPIIVGGTGLYFTALTEGLAEIPETPPAIRAEADRIRGDEGLDPMLADLDSETLARIDRQNPMRVQRAWEVWRATGRPLSAWQDDTPPPLLPLHAAQPLLVDAPRDWLNDRIARRFDAMLAEGALDEAQANLDGWDPALPSSRAIGAPELIAHLRGELTLDAAREAATVATRQYAKRQRTWFRARMKKWRTLNVMEK